MDGALILVVEDEPEIGDILAAYLTRDGFRVVRAADGETAVQHHARLAPDLVVLDVKLPRLDGYGVLGRIRRDAETPVILATALGDPVDRLAGFRVGADDYVVKPYNPAELSARVRAVLRRASGGAGRATIRAGAIEVDLAGHLARVVDGDAAQPLDLTLTEFRLLAHMARAPRRAFSRSELLDACLPPEGDALERTVDSHLSKLRRKLEAAGATGAIEAVRGVGYRLERAT